MTYLNVCFFIAISNHSISARAHFIMLLFFFPESLAVEETLSQLCSELQVIKKKKKFTLWEGRAGVMQDQCRYQLDVGNRDESTERVSSRQT